MLFRNSLAVCRCSLQTGPISSFDWAAGPFWSCISCMAQPRSGHACSTPLWSCRTSTQTLPCCHSCGRDLDPYEGTLLPAPLCSQGTAEFHQGGKNAFKLYFLVKNNPFSMSGVWETGVQVGFQHRAQLFPLWSKGCVRAQMSGDKCRFLNTPKIYLVTAVLCL